MRDCAFSDRQITGNELGIILGIDGDGNRSGIDWA